MGLIEILVVLGAGFTAVTVLALSLGAAAARADRQRDAALAELLASPRPAEPAGARFERRPPRRRRELV